MIEISNLYFVSGVDWSAKVDLSDFHLDSPQTEAATRAVEALYGKRSDIEIIRRKPLKVTKKERAANQIQAALIDLTTDDITGKCGIGTLLSIVRVDEIKNGENEWFISSREILQNVGIPKLIEIFDKKNPSGKTEKIN